MPKLKYIRDVVTLKLNQLRCIGCGMCLNVCPHAVFEMDGKKAQIVNRNDCMECGACAQNCPTTAVTVRAGIGCVTAIITGALRGTEPTCACSGDTSEAN